MTCQTRPRNAEEVLSRLAQVKPTGKNKYQAACPVPGHETPAGHLSLEDAGDKMLIKCFPGTHTYDRIVKALGFDSLTYDKTNGHQPNREAPEYETVATYNYRNADGSVFCRKDRRHPRGGCSAEHRKTFRFHYNDPETSREVFREPENIPPYNYHLLVGEIDKAGMAIINEGEGKADIVTALGFIGTPGPHGAGSWKEKHGSRMADMMVGLSKAAIFRDADNAGGGMALDCAQLLFARQIQPKIISMPPRPPHISPETPWNDVADWAKYDPGSLTREAIQKLIDEAPEWCPPEGIGDRVRDAVMVGEGPPKFGCTELENARRLEHHYGKDFYWVESRKLWFHWTGTHWGEDEGTSIGRLAQELPRIILEEASQAPNKKLMDELVAWAKASESSARIQAAIRELKPRVAMKMERFDTDVYLFNCLNGTLDFRSGELLPHHRDNLITILAPVAYDPAVSIMNFMNSLRYFFKDKPETIEFLQQFFGMCLTGDVTAQSSLFGSGDGANFKTTLSRVLRAVMGPYAMKGNIATFTLNKNIPENASHQDDVACYRGKRLIFLSETEQSCRLALSKFKDQSGDDVVRASHKYEKSMEFPITWKLAFFFNHLPEIKDNTSSSWRRIKFVPFRVSIPDDKRIDRYFEQYLVPELPGILAWLVEGGLRWMKAGKLPVCPDIANATSEYRREMDDLADFIEDCILESPNGFVPNELLDPVYDQYAADHKLDRILTHTQLHKAMVAHGFSKKKSTGGGRGHAGCLLRTAGSGKVADLAENSENLSHAREYGEKFTGCDATAATEGFGQSSFTMSGNNACSDGKSGKSGNLASNCAQDAPPTTDLPDCPNCGQCDWLFDSEGTRDCHSCGWKENRYVEGQRLKEEQK